MSETSPAAPQSQDRSPADSTFAEDAASAEKAQGTGAYRRLLRDGRFRRLWSAQFVSGIGDWLVIGLLMPAVSALSGGSSFAVAGILIAKLVPALILSSVTGVLVDRFDRRKVMITADLTRAALVLLLIGTNQLWVIYLVVLLMETASLFFWPARNALIPYLVEEHDVTAANGLAYTTQQASMLVGLTASAGILAAFEAAVRWALNSQIIGLSQLVGLFAPALLGSRAGYTLDTLTFLFSAAMIASIKVVARPPQSGERFTLSMLGADVLDSFRFLRDHRELRGLLVTIGLAILGGGAIVPVGVVYIPTLVGGVPFAERIDLLRQLAAAPTTLMLVFLALGMVSGALVVPRLERRLRLQLLFAGSVMAFGLSMFAFATTSRYWVAAIFGTIAGGCIATVTVAGNSYVVRTTTDDIRGRVFTALESVIKVALLTSMIVIAPVGDFIAAAVRKIALANGVPVSELAMFSGSRLTLQLASLIVIGASVYAFVVLRWRECDADEADPDSCLPQGATPDA